MISKQKLDTETNRKNIAEAIRRFGFFLEDEYIFKTTASYLKKFCEVRTLIEGNLGYVNDIFNNQIIITYSEPLDKIIDAEELREACEHCKIKYGERFSVKPQDLRTAARLLEQIAERKENKMMSEVGR